MTPEEFIRVYLPLGDSLYRVAFRLLGSQAEAEDAVQDLFIKVWSRRDGLDRVDNPRAWCLTLMRNLCVDRLRERAGKRRVPVEDDLPEEVGERSARMERILAAVRALPPKSRELLRLRLVEDMSFEEISQNTGLSQNALRVAFHRLKNQLKKKI
ncbi:MAG: sigma-70 family RNA polymerase sigma factor [Bacteroidales bacterium]|nr:sigma-70 family RNA polymerase sigma factor [Bacteroidales bacterium]